MNILRNLLLFLNAAITIWAGHVSGLLVDQQGRPVAAATVLVQSTAPGTGTTPPESRVATTSANGTFRSDVTGGTYLICVDAWTAGLLNPCEWSTPAAVSVGTAQSLGNVRIELAQGVRITVRVDDPQKLRIARDAGDLNTFAIPGVFTNSGEFHGGRWMGTDARGHIFELLVPADRDLELAIESMNVKVTDLANQEVTRQTRKKLKVKQGEKHEYDFKMVKTGA